MKSSKFMIAVLTLACTIPLAAQDIDFTKAKLEAVNVSMASQKLEGKNTVRVVKNPGLPANEATFVKLTEQEFKDGTIEVSVLSKLLPDAPSSARGFIGVVFRITGDNSKFECIYIRPTNGRADDQVRRNHSIQYTSYPDYDVDRFRKESPEKYESYADMGLNEWIKLKIVVKGTRAKLYVNDAIQPSLLVNDMKLGADQSGSVGLFVDNGTEGFFADVKISKQLVKTQK